jgi:hypothetical protein
VPGCEIVKKSEEKKIGVDLMVVEKYCEKA